MSSRPTIFRLPAVLRSVVVVALLVPELVHAAPASPRSVDLVRDRYGVPHLFVDGRGDAALAAAAYATGYAQAEDRLFEMDLFRRAARGRLAELPALGAAFLPMDLDARRDGSTPFELARDVERLAPRDGRLLRAFTRGVNRFIAEVTADPSRLPLEYLGQTPEPWIESDTLAIGELQLGRFAVGGGNELRNARLLIELRARFGDAAARGIFDDLVWIDDPSAPVTIDSEESSFTGDHPVRFAPAQMALLDRLGTAVARAAQRIDAERETVRTLASRLAIPAAGGHASNAIVVAGRLTASGQPILLGGPQTGLNIPSFFWEVGVQTRDGSLHGVGVPGTPGISMGRTDRFAFSITSAADDDTDIYAEILDPADPGRYLHAGQMVAFERRTEVFVVAGGAPVVREFLRSVHGPVLEVDAAAGLAFSRRRALDGRYTRAGSETLHLALARSLGEFLAIARHLEAGFNLHVADVDGNIAYVHAGRRPGRPDGTDPRLPLLGSGEQEWGRVLRRRPLVKNPRSGVIVNWNNKPAAGWPAGDQPEFWGPIDRVLGLKDGLAAELAAGGPLARERVNAVMRHAATSDIFVSRIAPFLHAAVMQVEANAPDRVRLLEADAFVTAWVAAGAPLVAIGDRLPHPGATIYRAFRTAAQRLVLRDELGSGFRDMFYPIDNFGNQEDDHGSYGTPDALFYRVLQGAAAAIPPSRNYFDDVDTGMPGTRESVLVAALRVALTALSARFGTDDMSAWLEPRLVETYMSLGGIDLLFGPTVAERQNRGSFNLLIEPGVPGGGQIIVPPGQSGALPTGAISTEPPHLRDQLPLYEAFTYRRMADTRADVEAPTTLITLVLPAGL